MIREKVSRAIDYVSCKHLLHETWGEEAYICTQERWNNPLESEEECDLAVVVDQADHKMERDWAKEFRGRFPELAMEGTSRVRVIRQTTHYEDETKSSIVKTRRVYKVVCKESGEDLYEGLKALKEVATKEGTMTMM